MRNALFIILIGLPALVKAENGYELWLRYKPVENKTLLTSYRSFFKEITINSNSVTAQVIRDELTKASKGMLQQTPTFHSPSMKTTGLVVGSTIKQNETVFGQEGFSIHSGTPSGKPMIYINANTDIGLLYGVFHLLRLMQTEQSIAQLNILSVPRIKLRMLNHWDNLNRTVERGYAGFSIWNWHTLPDFIDKRYIDYARANASIGINGTVLTNVNANAVILTKPYLEKVKALADIFRPYGIKVYLTARFSAPIEIGRLRTADPLNDTVQQWWKQKVKEIYELIPDFGGFLVKANSEGQPGPQDYNRTHADGANMLADAVAPFKGIVMWRAFVYSSTAGDRFKQAYEEFKPLDGKFRKNVLVQVKNGPIDFQPREPFSPLFGAMPQTPLMMEFQLTQEYLGQGTHLVYEAPLFKEVLNADTYSKARPDDPVGRGKGSTVAKVIDGSLDNFSLTGMAGVSNIGNDINWCSHPFAQSNWYTLGRLSWDPTLSSEQIADEWIKQTFTNNPLFVVPVKKIMLESREVLVNYMTPLGLTHIMYNGHHYGPMPWGNTLGRPDWNPVYYHKADSNGIGFDRTATGSNALAQYAVEVQNEFKDINTCPEDYLLWFHHVPWNHKMRSGRNFWEELCYKYYTAVDSMKAIQQQWNKLSKYIDTERFDHVKQ
ncbi:MAG TPA: alpha-glucuronidase family glycosyl hydrolase, partial [Chitinophagaceae bacterium]